MIATGLKKYQSQRRPKKGRLPKKKKKKTAQHQLKKTVDFV